MTYSELKTQIANYLGRSDLTSQIPHFIEFAELRMSRDLRTRKMLKTAAATMTAGDATVGFPSDFIGIKDIHIQGNPRQSVVYQSPSVFSNGYRADESGVPKFYTLRANEFEFAPVPDSAYTAQMTYYFKPQELSDSNQTNEFSANYPDALLYGALVEAEPYLMNDSRITVWANMYQKAVDRINESDQDSEFAAVPLVMSLR